MTARSLLLTLCVIACSLQPIRAIASADSVDRLIQTALSLDASPRRGARLFDENCAGCHGADASGNAAYAVPSLARQRQSYLVKQLADFAEGDRVSTIMHSIVRRQELREPQTWSDIAAYLNSLQPRTVQHGDGAGLSLGEAIYREQCSSCHEEDARGDDDGFVPALRDQHYNYLLRQLHGLAHGRRNVEDDLKRFIASLQDDELSAVADYLSRFKGGTHDRARMKPNGVAGD